jgi:hypothetical protein
MDTLEEYLERADELVQEVYKAYGEVGNIAPLTPEFSALLDKAFRYKNANRVADNHREHGVLTEKVADAVKTTRQTFAEAYKNFWEKHETPRA